MKRAVKKIAREPAKKPANKTAKPKSAPSRIEWPRDPALEQAILDAPLDPAPRMVYADWVQAAGDRRGEWMALHAAIEADPKNVRLRSAAVDFLGENAELLLGPGRKVLAGAWIGWRGGFIDEIRIQPVEHQRGTIESFAGLLAHPSARFVRTVGIGALGQDALDVLATAAPPLLDTVVAVDAAWGGTEVDLDGVAALPSIRRLGLYKAELARELPQLVEIGCRTGPHLEWMRAGGCPNLEKLTIECAGSVGEPIAKLVRALPKLRELRLLHLGPADDLFDAILGLRELQLLDVSHTRFGDADAERFVGWHGLETLIALRCDLTASAIARLEKAGTKVIASNGRTRVEDDRQAEGGWLHHRIAADGRDGLAAFPGIGRALFNVGTNHSIHAKAKDATPLLDISLSFPNQELKTWAWANAAIAHERVGNFDEAELIAREGMLRTPKEPNLYAIVIDALRRTNRLSEAVALLPRSFASIDAKPGPGAHTGGRRACLADCMLVLAQAGKHADVLDCRDKWPELVDERADMHAILAMSEVALGKLVEARASLVKAAKSPFPGVLAHAKAVVGLTAKRPDLAKALAQIQTCKDGSYPEWHWIASDPNLAKLRSHPGFRALIGA